MRRPSETQYLMWGDQVFERVGHRDEVYRARKPSGVVAKRPIAIGGFYDRWEPGDELPTEPHFPHGAQRIEIPVAFDRAPDLEALIERGDAKRKRSRGRS